MKKLKASSQYKKDYKRFRNNPKKIEKLNCILKNSPTKNQYLKSTTHTYFPAITTVIWDAI